MSLRTWSRLHTWSSLVCTVFLLLLCLTGLPLIFHHEIGHLTGTEVEAPAMPPGTPMADLDRVVAAAQAQRPGEVVQFLIWDEDDPALLSLSMAPSPTAPPEALSTVMVDARTATVLAEPNFREGFMYWMLRLHTDLFAGIPGKLFLGAMGLLFVVATVSGAVLYGPFARHGRFGTVRSGRSARLRWLDLHNILGVVTLSWVLVVGATGVVNTLALSVLERTRELGLVRAVGLTRAQTMWMVTVEAVIIAVFGALLGVVSGSGLGAAAVRALSASGITTLAIPWARIGLYLLAGVAIGAVAAVVPAVRAARTNVLRAISYE